MDSIKDFDRTYIYKQFHINNGEEAKVLGTHMIHSLDSIPVKLEKGSIYSMWRWDRSFYVEAEDDHKVKILDQRGGEFLPDQEYIIILPKY